MSCEQVLVGDNYDISTCHTALGKVVRAETLLLADFEHVFNIESLRFNLPVVGFAKRLVVSLIDQVYDRVELLIAEGLRCYRVMRDRHLLAQVEGAC